MTEYRWIDLGNGRQVFRRIKEQTVARSSLPMPMLARDQIEIKSMVDGQIYTSKAALRQSYRENGYIEIGNEDVTKHVKPKKVDTRKEVRHSVRKALSQVGIST